MLSAPITALNGKATLRIVADLIEFTSANPDAAALVIAIVGVGKLAALGANHTCLLLVTAGAAPNLYGTHAMTEAFTWYPKSPAEFSAFRCIE